MTWEEFSSQVQARQVGFMGEPNEVRPGRGEFHENPTSCICEHPNAKSKNIPLPRKIGNDISKTHEAVDDEDEYMDDDRESYNQDENEDGIVSNLRYLLNETNVDEIPSLSEENDLEELLSD